MEKSFSNFIGFVKVILKLCLFTLSIYTGTILHPYFFTNCAGIVVVFAALLKNGMFSPHLLFDQSLVQLKNFFV